MNLQYGQQQQQQKQQQQQQQQQQKQQFIFRDGKSAAQAKIIGEPKVCAFFQFLSLLFLLLPLGDGGGEDRRGEKEPHRSF